MAGLLIILAAGILIGFAAGLSAGYWASGNDDKTG